MEAEIINLLKKEGKLSEKTIDEIRDIEINDFADIIKEVGNEPTEHIKREEITEGLNTKII